MLWFAKWLRLTLAWLDLCAFTLLMLLLARLPMALLSARYPSLFQAWCRCFVRALGVELRLHQHHKKPLPPQYILIANHPSALEDVGIPAFFPVRNLAKEEVRHWWFVGRIAEAAGTLFVKREEKEARQTALLNMIAAVKAGHSIALYPEGGCKGRRLWDKFLYGAFIVSIETQIPILPVFLYYEAQEAFEWGPNTTLIQKIWQIMRSPNHVAHYHVFDPLEASQFKDKDDYANQTYALYSGWQKRFLE
ncbi:lysophospholipid acyltransferase family protein [Iodobacter fluviatilis]|uniref:1-acyl-sn-glycerol-3-phosphate acyltransferase n=1 Tax=Iodobacter fluviatilis TaxID=537 RepID=A0A377SX64_9NEIS|nr:lysophospholipid acyltransferase family protein [Iodobacter fluviatilis]TCU88082.1 1-acyl-sn-glycerol-3-phosphate acyltransferase [Iodobacter fluviatilis]STR45583.1 1-acylglycerol-3-phosphate O-acyltransferases [Iodobacter fluviatilis]